jgi:hypothetical protein
MSFEATMQVNHEGHEATRMEVERVDLNALDWSLGKAPWGQVAPPFPSPDSLLRLDEGASDQLVEALPVQERLQGSALV